METLTHQRIRSGRMIFSPGAAVAQGGNTYKRIVSIKREILRSKKPKYATRDSSAPPRRCDVYIFLRV